MADPGAEERGGMLIKMRGNALHVEEGMWLKVRVPGEKFWCWVICEQTDGSFICSVANDLVTLTWRCGDRVVVHRSHVLETADMSDFFAFLALANNNIIRNA